MMKRLFYAVSLLLGLSVLFSSCEKSGTDNGDDEESPIVGCWIYVAIPYTDKVDEYFEYTNTGQVKDYFTDKGYATFKDGVLSFPGEWVLDDVYDYWVKDGLYWDEEFGSYEFEMIGKDKFGITWTDKKGERWTDCFVRIKKFTK